MSGKDLTHIPGWDVTRLWISQEATQEDTTEDENEKEDEEEDEGILCLRRKTLCYDMAFID